MKSDEASRLKVLASYAILDTVAEPAFDDISRIAGVVCGTPVSLVSFVADARQWFKAKRGVDLTETPINQSICRHALEEGDVLIIPDTLADRRTNQNPLVMNEPNFRFYAGATIVVQNVAIGTVCVLDTIPRNLSDDQIEVLRALARQVVGLLEARKVSKMYADRQRHLNAIFKSATDYAIIALSLDARITDWNEGARRILGWEPAEIVGRSIQEIFTPEDNAAGISEMEMKQARARGRGLDDRFHLRRDGSRFWASGEMMPLEDTNNEIVGFIKILRDETAKRRNAEIQRNDAEFMRSVLASSRDCIVVLDLEGHTLFVSPGGIDAMEISDVDAILRLSWLRVWTEGDAKSAHAAVDIAREGGTGRFQGFCPTHKGTPKWWDVVISPLLGADGKPERLLSIGRDITFQKNADERQKMLLAELAHRVKNTLAVVQSIAAQTFRNAPTIEEAGKSLSARLLALSEAHDILLQGSWSRAGMHAIARIACRSLQDDEQDRVSIEGPEFNLGAQSALSFALILHELGTNAVKYGALSNGEGRVEMRWIEEGAAEERRIHFTWIEAGGPPVEAPNRKGFGSRLIERSLAQTMSATVLMDYDPAGVRFTLDALLSDLQNL